MEKNNLLVSIIILNYNGKLFLEECFSSLYKIDFPKEKYEIIMVDNGSSDLSVKFTKGNFPDIRIIESKVNLGFAGGCNLGVKESRGKYVVFLNNDTKVEKKWLEVLVKRIESNTKISAVNSKLLFYYPFIELTINSDIFMRSEFTKSINFQSVGILVENVILEDRLLQDLVRYRSGFYDKEKGAIPVRWTKGMAKILIPCNPTNQFTKMTLTIRSEKTSSDLKTKISINLGNEVILEDVLESYEVKQYKISLENKKIEKTFVYAVQNSGVVVFKDGYGRDRGAVVGANRTQFYEIDNSFYNSSSSVNSFCGASVIIRRDIFEKLGGFDESFFMYYEDVDLSLRMNRAGYEIVYEPRSVVFHIHAGSSGEWSSFFTYHVEKNHLAVLVKHFPIEIILKEFFLYTFLWIVSILRMLKWRLREHWELYEEYKEKVECRTNVLRWLVGNFISLAKSRRRINIMQRRTMQEVYKELY